MQRFCAVFLLPLLLLVQGTVGILAASATSDPQHTGEDSASGRQSSVSLITRNVVRIEVTVQDPDYKTPWNSGRIGGGIGSGFVISGHRILTNAHVASNARFITVTREGLSHPYPARVQYIAHDCDLALLTVDDEKFFQGTAAFDFGGIPEIESPVAVYGYPLGGERLSVTRGIVSRIDFEPYTHSAVDSHLVVQIDAAINPGNSGGPVIQRGKVIGVAFQGYSGDVAQNVGFMIPTPVIRRFLKDVESGHYDGYMDLSANYQPLQSPAMRRFLALPETEGGVFVSDVFAGGASDGHLQPGDVLLSIDDHPIASNGRVELDGQSMEMAEVVERKFAGDKVRFKIWRKGQQQEVSFPLCGPWPFKMQASAYDERPRFILYAGLLFQPLERNFMVANGGGDLRLRYLFDQFVSGHIYQEYPEIIVLSGILSDPINKECENLQPGVVENINGRPIRHLEDVQEAFAQPATFDIIKLMGHERPIILERSEVEKARARIIEHYGIGSESNLKP